MKKLYLTGLLVLLSLVAMAQGGTDVYLSPFDFPMVFSGNYGEIRANHFHGGLDIKTQGTTGKPIRAQANGYISRIRVNTGSGYVLNVTYDNGYYLIYRHLSKFTPAIDERVKQIQYEQEQWEVDIIPETSEYLVKADGSLNSDITIDDFSVSMEKGTLFRDEWIQTGQRDMKSCCS